MRRWEKFNIRVEHQYSNSKTKRRIILKCFKQIRNEFIQAKHETSVRQNHLHEKIQNRWTQ